MDVKQQSQQLNLLTFGSPTNENEFLAKKKSNQDNKAIF